MALKLTDFFAPCWSLLMLTACVTTPVVYSHGLGVGVGRDAYDRALDPPKIVDSQLSAEVSKGRQIYLEHCADCHGSAGLGNGSSATGMDPRPANLIETDTRYGEKELYALITTGRRDMPSWKDVLTEEELWQVVRYVRTLKTSD